MRKIKLGIIFGGMSTEHEVSVISGKSIIKHLNKEKYEIFPIYIDKDGKWYELKNSQEEENKEKNTEETSIEENITQIKNIVKYLKNLDVVFPILHGKYGEDGTIQGMLELLKIPTCGCRSTCFSNCNG